MRRLKAGGGRSTSPSLGPRWPQSLPLTSSGKPSLTTSSTGWPTHVTLYSFTLPESYSPSSPMHVCCPDLNQSSRGLCFLSSTSLVPGRGPQCPLSCLLRARPHSKKQEPQWLCAGCAEAPRPEAPASPFGPGKAGSLQAASVPLASLRPPRLPEPSLSLPRF